MQFTAEIYADGDCTFRSDWSLPSQLEHQLRKVVTKTVKEFYQR